MAASPQALPVGQESDLVATVSNNGGASSLQTHLVISLPPTVTLLGPPYFERGSGCTGTQTVDCNLDYIPSGTSTTIKFAVRVDASGPQSIQATAGSAADANAADNTAAVVLDAQAPVGSVVTPPAAKVVCRVPSLIGLGLARAKIVIARARCTTGQVRRTSSTHVAKGRVIAQSPRAGRTLRKGARVDLTVSAGRPKRR